MVKQKESSNSKLRFAALIRVSTEQQEKTGESLRTQKTDIEKSVEQLGGIIVAWYGGQEHATPGHEKKEIDRLLNDAQKLPKRFDAVIVTDADRWSRDNEKSKEGLAIFRKCDIEFFVGTSKWDLHNPEHCLILGMFSEIGEFFAVNQKRKSLKSRISRAKRGIPTSGKLPYGRMFVRSDDKQTGRWVIDKKKQASIQAIAERYLAGEKLPELAEEFGMNHSNLHKILTKRCGSLWPNEFNSDDLKIHAKVEMKIPPLLPDNIIAAILKKADANRTYLHAHGKAKYQYLLGRRIFCKHCGYVMSGQTNRNEQRYYRHAHTKRERECNRSNNMWLNADELEAIVLLHLFECFGNPKAVEKAIEKAIPNLEKIKEYQQQLVRIEGELDKVKLGRERIINFVANDKITDKDATKQFDKLKQNEISLQTKQQQINDSLENCPDPDRIKAVSQKVSAQFRRYSPLALRVKVRAVAGHLPYDKMTYEEKLALVEMVFSSKTPDGKKMGVYIEWSEKGWGFDIHGQLINEQGLIPLSDSQKEAYFDNDGFQDIRKQGELNAVIKNALY